MTDLAQANRWIDRVWGDRDFGDRTGHFFFAFGVDGRYDERGKYKHKSWQERHGRWPDDVDRFLEEALERAKTDDVYVAPYLRSNASRKKGSALPSSILYADADELDPSVNGFESQLIGPGGLLVDSGRGRHVYLSLSVDLDPAELEQLNRQLARYLHADAGWAENKVLRLPGTFNHKGRARGGDPLPVLILDGPRADRNWTPDELLELFGPEPENLPTLDIEPVMPTNVPKHLAVRLDEEPGVHPGAQTFGFVGACVDAGLSDEEVLALGLRYPPAIVKFGPGTPRLRGDIERSIQKHRKQRADADPGASPTGTYPHRADAATSSLTSSRLRPQVTSSLVPLPLGRDEVETSSPTSSPEPSSWAPVDIVAKAARPPEPPQIIELFYPGLNHLVSGESEALKTWLMMIASTDELSDGRGVLWVDGDDVGSGALLERLRLLGADDDAIASHFAYVLPDEPLGPDLRSDVLEVVQSRACRLAVFDGFNPLLLLHGLDPNSGGDVEAFYRLLDPIRKLDVAIVITDNVVKASEARGAWAIGSERKKSKAEVHLGMKTIAPLVRGGTGKAQIAVHKDRPGYLTRPSPGVLVLSASDDECSWRVDPDQSRDGGGEFRPTELMERVSRHLEVLGEPASRNQIEQARHGKGSYVRAAIDRLVVEGYVSEFDGPRRARLVRLERPFRKGEDDAAADDEAEVERLAECVQIGCTQLRAEGFYCAVHGGAE